MKKLFSLVLVGALATSLIGCTSIKDKVTELLPAGEEVVSQLEEEATPSPEDIASSEFIGDEEIQVEEEITDGGNVDASEYVGRTVTVESDTILVETISNGISASTGYTNDSTYYSMSTPMGTISSWYAVSEGIEYFAVSGEDPANSLYFMYSTDTSMFVHDTSSDVGEFTIANATAAYYEDSDLIVEGTLENSGIEYNAVLTFDTNDVCTGMSLEYMGIVLNIYALADASALPQRPNVDYEEIDTDMLSQIEQFALDLTDATTAPETEELEQIVDEISYASFSQYDNTKLSSTDVKTAISMYGSEDVGVALLFADAVVTPGGIIDAECYASLVTNSDLVVPEAGSSIFTTTEGFYASFRATEGIPDLFAGHDTYTSYLVSDTEGVICGILFMPGTDHLNASNEGASAGDEEVEVFGTN